MVNHFSNIGSAGLPMPAADEVMLYKAFNSLFNSLFKWKGSVFLPFLNSSLDIVAKTCQSRGKQRIAVFIKLLPDTEHDNPRFVCVSSA